MYSELDLHRCLFEALRLHPLGMAFFAFGKFAMRRDAFFSRWNEACGHCGVALRLFTNVYHHNMFVRYSCWGGAHDEAATCCFRAFACDVGAPNSRFLRTLIQHICTKHGELAASIEQQDERRSTAARLFTEGKGLSFLM